MAHIDRLTTRYARALYSHAADRGQQEEVLRQLRLLSAALQKRPDLQVMLQHPEVADEAKVAELKQIIQDRESVASATEDFLKLVVENDRPEVLRAAPDAFLQLWDEARGVQRAYVRTAVSLSDDDKDSLKQALRRLAAKDVVLEIEVDGDLIGGFSVRMDDHFIDGTIRGRLDRILENARKRATAARSTREI